jgi:putative endopeptidase
MVASNLTARGIDPFFILYIDENPEKRKELIATVDTSDFTIRFPPYYELAFEDAVRVQNLMRAYVADTFIDQGMNSEQAQHAADVVFRIERRMAQAEMGLNTSSHFSSEDLKAGTYQVQDLKNLFPGINWDALFERSGRPDIAEIYILKTHYLREVGRILTAEPLEDLKIFLTWRVLQFAAPFATPAMQDRYYRFYDEKLSKREITPQKDRIFEIMNLYLGNPIAHLYVDRYFTASDKAKVEEIIKNIRDVMRERVMNLSWMDEETKQIALAKMDLLKEQAGYPEDWGQYRNLTIGDQSYLENMLALTEYFTNGSLQLSGQPSDPDVWYVSPHGVEAHYDLVHNRIIAPAGFLNPPFFDPMVDDAWNYGSFGWVYGHELIHMIDIGGQQYRPDGKKENWWTDDDANRYFHAAWPLITQVNSTKVLDNLTLNGTRMLIESSADLGGLTLAYHAFVRSRDPARLDVPGPDGLTDRQRFFIAFAQSMRGNITDENLRNLTVSEDHPWNKYRVNLIPFHLDEFYEAFPDINPDDPLYLNESDRARLW